MDFDFISLYKAWVSLFAIAFTLSPIVFVLEWRKRKSAEGFSSVNFVLAVFINLCWLKHGLVIDEFTTIRIHGTNIAILSVFLSIYAYYQPHRKTFIIQLLTAFTAVAAIYLYVDAQESESRGHVMGSIAATMQVLRNAGSIYEIIRIIRMKHTEYAPWTFTFMVFAMVAQWIVFGILTENVYIVRAHLPGLIGNIVMISLYYFYPPLTWRVPIIGTGPQQKKIE